MEKSHQETNRGWCSNPTAAWTALICGSTTLQRSFSSISVSGLIEAVRNMENCQSCVALSSSQPYPHQTAQCTACTSMGDEASLCYRAPFWLLQTFAGGDLLQLLLSVFTGREHPCREISLLLQEDHVALGKLNPPSTRPEGSNARNVMCGFTWFIKHTKRFVLAQEHRGAMKRAEWHQGIISS